jgi:hypothetical protein
MAQWRRSGSWRKACAAKTVSPSKASRPACITNGGRTLWRLAGDTSRGTNNNEVKDLRREAPDLKEIVAEQMLEMRPLKKA